MGELNAGIIPVTPFQQNCTVLFDTDTREGVVVDLRGTGDKTEITVNFPTVGQKVLLLAWAPLKKA